MKTLVVNKKNIVSIVVVLLLTYGVQGTSYGQAEIPNVYGQAETATVTPGETNTSLMVDFQITLDEGVNESAYQFQLRRKTPPGEWISKCLVIERGEKYSASYSSQGGTVESDVFVWSVWYGGGFLIPSSVSTETFNIRVIFTGLEPRTTYEARYRDTNLPECAQNPPVPDPWSEVVEGTTHLVAPARAEFIDAKLARKIRDELRLNTSGGHIELLKIPKASLAKLTELDLDSSEITNLTGLEHATQLRTLSLMNNQISDITPLAQLTQLTELDLFKNQIINVRPLAQLTQLITLRLWGNQISDISPLVELPSLESLSLSYNQINDVTSLTTFASVDSLRYLHLTGNPITDVSPVRKIKREHPDMRIYIDIPVILTDPGSGPDLYVIDGGSLIQLNLNRINVQEMGPKSLPSNIAIDVIGDKIYWATRYDILRANLDGTHVQEVVTGLDEPENIAVDVSGGKIYWTIERGDRIQHANLDGTHIRDVVTGLYRPYGIALDVPGSKIYWMEEDDHRILRANLDGTHVQEVVSGLDEPKDIAIDVSGGKIYWTDSNNRIQRANLDGSDVQVVVPNLGSPRGITLDVSGGKIYWTDYSNNRIQRANLDGSDVQVVVIGISRRIIAFHSFTHTTDTTTSVRKEDVNDDGIVNIADLVLVASNLGETGQNAADVNGDGVVNIADLVLVAAALDNSAAAPSLYPYALEMLTAADVKQWLSAAQQFDITDTMSRRGILFLQQLLVALTPKETALLPNFPNPFNPETWIPYHLAKDADVTLHIYAVNGTLVRTLTLGHQPTGMYQSRSRAAYWDGRNEFGENVASGLYFYRLTAGDFTATRKMLIRK